MTEILAILGGMIFLGLTIYLTWILVEWYGTRTSEKLGPWHMEYTCQKCGHEVNKHDSLVNDVCPYCGHHDRYGMVITERARRRTPDGYEYKKEVDEAW